MLFVLQCLTNFTSLVHSLKGREEEMFSKLARKYNVANPLLSNSQNNEEAQSSKNNLEQSTAEKSILQSTNTHTTFKSESTSNPFGSSNNPFGQKPKSNSLPASSPFGTSSQSNTVKSSVPFGQSSSGFGSNTTQTFGSTSIAFGASNQSSHLQPTVVKFGGRTPKEILVAFYNKYNPSKVSEVDKFLTKYSGKEEQMFRNLAKKYNVDPSLFGISNPPQATAGFGSTPGKPTNNTFGSPSFGQPSTLSNTTSPFGSPSTSMTGAFGSSQLKNQSSGFGTVSSGGGFGSLAASAPTGFGSPPTTTGSSFNTFGTTSVGFGNPTGNMSGPTGNTTPFGAARR